MKLIVTLRDPSLGEDAREYARERIAHLRHYFDRITSAEVILSVVTNHRPAKRAEFIVHANRGAVFVAQADGQDIKSAIDRAQGEMKREILRHKERLTDHHRARRESAERKGRLG